MELQTLVSLILERAHGKATVAVALSGGVDSGLVAAAAHEAVGQRAVACTVVSELTPARDRSRAAEVAAHIGIRHHLPVISVLDDPGVRENSARRCYHCKRHVFQAMREAFGSDCLLLDGTNRDDDPARPGLQAVGEFEVLSPLYAAGMDKDAVRELARKVGLPNWDAPSESCLATRISPGAPLTGTGLAQVEAMEIFWHGLGVETVRARLDNLMATVEYLPQYAEIIILNRDNFVALVEKIGLRSCVFKEWRE